MIQEIVMKILAASGTVTGLVDGTSIHYVERPGASIHYKLPAVVIQLISDEPYHTFDGPSPVRHGVVRVTVLAGKYLDAMKLSRAVEGALNGATGPYTLADSSSVELEYIMAESASEVPSDHRDGENKIRTHGIQQDFKFMTQTAE